MTAIRLGSDCFDGKRARAGAVARAEGRGPTTSRTFLENRVFGSDIYPQVGQKRCRKRRFNCALE